MILSFRNNIVGNSKIKFIIIKLANNLCEQITHGLITL